MEPFNTHTHTHTERNDEIAPNYAAKNVPPNGHGSWHSDLAFSPRNQPDRFTCPLSGVLADLRLSELLLDLRTSLWPHNTRTTWQRPTNGRKGCPWIVQLRSDRDLDSLLVIIHCFHTSACSAPSRLLYSLYNLLRLMLSARHA